MFLLRAAVIGAGSNGAGIARLVAAAGVPVVLVDPSGEALERARELIERDARAQLEAPGRLTEEQVAQALAATLAALTLAESEAALGDVDLVIDASDAELSERQALFARLDAAAPARALLAASGSLHSISELAAATSTPERVVGMHLLPPVGERRVIEIVEGIESSSEALAAAALFATRIRRTPIRCADVPGFVLARILFAAAGELWRARAEQGFDPLAADAALVSAGEVTLGPFAFAQRLGPLATPLAEQLRDAHGPRFHAPPAAGQGAPLGERDGAELAERYALRLLGEALLVLQERVASAREIDLALASAGMPVGPLMAADQTGLDPALARFERAAARWGEDFAAPVILRRLLAAGRRGRSVGHGLFGYPGPAAPAEGLVRLERRERFAIAWLEHPPVNALSKAMLDALRAAWEQAVAAGDVHALILASADPRRFCAGADIRGFTELPAGDGRARSEQTHAWLLELERSPIVTIAAVGAAALGGGCELAMACDVRIAGESASFGQPEIALGIIPGFGGTQRLPRLVGVSKALEMNLLGTPITAQEAWEFGLVNRVVPDHELFDTALAWARELAARAPLAVAQIKRVSGAGELEQGIAAERDAFAEVLASEDAQEGITAFLAKRPPRFVGR